MSEYRPSPETVLNYQYGLLEPPEAERVKAWLATPEGAAARHEAERVSGLFAAAAKSAFPEVRFEPPSPATIAASAQRPERRWLSWFVAAAMLLAAGAPFAGHEIAGQRCRQDLAVAQGQLESKQRELQDLYAKRETVLHAARERVIQARDRFNSRQAEFSAGYRRIEDDLSAKQLSLVISGPATVLAGAPNEFRIQTVDGRNQPTPATVIARVKDPKELVVFEQDLGRSTGMFNLKLPADLPLKPNRELFLEVTAHGDAGPKSELREQLQLAVPLYLTHLTTEKPMYQPGETVYFRSLTLERFTLKPPPDDFHLQFVVLDPKQAETAIVSGASQLAADKSPVLGPDGQPLRGIGSGMWTIPAEAAGGEYTLIVREAQGRFPEIKRKFLINRYRPDQLEKELEWSRKSYGPGDVVVANCKVSRATGEPLAGRPVRASAIVDGVEIPVEPPSATDEGGRVAIRFTLPNSIERGAGSINVAFNDGGNDEPLNKPIPIALKKLEIEFFPEGGDLVAGALNRVYFQARTTLGKPADVTGRLVDGGGREVARAATLTDDQEAGINQGMGRFEFAAEFGQTYHLTIETPVGIQGEYKLPPIKADGVVLTALDDVNPEPGPLRVRVTSLGNARSLLIGAYARGRLLDHQRVAVKANGSAEIALNPEPGFGGVTRVTVFEELEGNGSRRTLKPVAERLVYRKPSAALNLAVHPDRARYSPGDKTHLRITAADEKHQPTTAVLYMSVVNQSIVTMADEKTARALPTHFLLTSEVKQPEDLEHADVLLGSHPKAAAALDLLLGTQGWRRFAEQTPDDFRQKAGDDADRLLVAEAGAADNKRLTTSLEMGYKKLAESLGPDIEASSRAVEEAQLGLQSLQETVLAKDAEQKILGEQGDAATDVRSARRQLGDLEDSWQHTLRWLLPAMCAMALFTAIAAMAAGVLRGIRWYVPAAASLAVAAVAAVMLTVHVEGSLTRSPIELASIEMAPKGTVLNGRVDEIEKPGQVDLRLGEGVTGKADGGRAFKRDMPAPSEAKPEPKAAAVAPPTLATTPAAPSRPAAAEMDAAKLNKAKEPGDELKDRTRGFGDVRKQTPNLGVVKERGDKKPLADNLARRTVEELNAPRQKANLEAKTGEKVEAFGRPPGVPQAIPAPGGAAGFGGGGGAPAAGGKLGGGEDRMRNAKPIFSRPPPEPLIVRQYAFQHSLSQNDNRSDFAETLFWHPALVVPKDGTDIAFDLSDSVTRYRVLAAGHTLDGRLGSVTTHIEARKSLSIQPKLPVEITHGDRLDVPVTIANDSNVSRKLALTAAPKGLTLRSGNLDQALTLAPEQRARQVYAFQPTIPEGQAELRFTGNADGVSDSINVSLPVVAEGFPVVGSISDVLEHVAQHQVVLPETWVPGTLKCQVSVFPSTLAELQRGLDGLLREPGGCFEQTSTTNYPNTLILEYLRESDQASPMAMQRAKELLERGYSKLASFEVAAASKREGFEWFGQAPAHEALTAYGLMQFRDMAKVSDVDPMMLNRTRDYLLSRRDGQGGFQRSPRALDSFGRAPDEVTNAYIIWALTEGSKEDDVSRELNQLADQAKQSKDPYFLALVANALLNRDRTEDALVILQSLGAALTKDGYLDGAQTSITGSTGRMLQIETTALAVLGWLKINRPAEFAAPIRSAVSWIGKQRGGFGGFGSTQSTILALKALIAFTKANKQMPEAGELTLYVGAKEIGRRPFTTGTSGELTIAVSDADKRLKPGKNDLRVEITGKNTYPYTLTWSYQTVQPPSAEGCAVRLTTKLDKSAIAESDATQLKMTLENVSGKGQGMTVAILGLPAGLKLPDDFKQLKDLARLRPDGKPGPIGAFELRGRELVLYWRDLAPEAKIDLAIDLRGYVPGEYTGPASRAYLYYNPDAKHWTAPVKATIRACE